MLPLLTTRNPQLQYTIVFYENQTTVIQFYKKSYNKGLKCLEQSILIKVRICFLQIFPENPDNNMAYQ